MLYDSGKRNDRGGGFDRGRGGRGGGGFRSGGSGGRSGGDHRGFDDFDRRGRGGSGGFTGIVYLPRNYMTKTKSKPVIRKAFVSVTVL